jgi:alkylation response protein AidB-like acyl-CoA dehydrogenase
MLQDNRTPDADSADAVERARSSAPLIAAASDEIERERKLTDVVMAALHKARLFRLLMPQSVDGEEVEPIVFFEMLEEIAKADASVAWCLNQTSVCSMWAALLREDVAKRIFSPPNALLASGFGTNTRAIPTEGGYRVSGTWAFGSGAHHATWLGAGCTVCDAQGNPIRDSGGKPLGRFLLAPKAKAKMTDVWRVLGLRGTGSDAYTFTDLFVPEEESFAGISAPPQTHAKGALYLFPHDSMWAGGFASIALGLARATLDALIQMAQEKTPRGFKRPLSESSAIQVLVAQSDVRIRASRLFLFSAFSEIWAAVEAARRIDLHQRMTIRLAASHAIQQARQVVDECYHAAGTTAVFASSPFERRFRDIHMVTQHAHGRQSHFESVGQLMLGLTPDTAFL